MQLLRAEPPATKVDDLAGDTLGPRFPDLIGKPGVLLVNPSEAGNECHAQGVIVETERRCHVLGA
ncbi:MAG TPA: hypothetical protein VJO52_06620 [Gemmatimonadaceae bacterium]|nr:hypothetical protein [Gemmatimonadaceae bacterium]